jgi:phage terminase large subunit GpA-like protein
LIRDNFRYDYDPELRRVSRAWFVCTDCGAEIEEHHKATMLPELGYGGQARWVAESQGDGETISVHLPAYYAPLGTITWVDLALQLARAIEREKIGDPEGMRAYVNTREGLPYDGTDKSTTAEKLMARAEPYAARTIPDEALVVTMFADVQRTWLEVTIEGWGPGMQHWVLDHTRLWGSPSVSPETPGSVWQQLTELRNTPLQHERGLLIPISAFGVDSGDGEHAQDVYNYAYLTEHLGCLATKGASARNRPIIAGTPTKVDVDWNGRRLAEGVKLWQLGTDTAKDHLFNRMLLTEGPGAMRFHRGLGLEFFQQLLVERPQVSWRKGRAVREYIKPNGARNEVLDCSVGNLSVAHYLGLHRWAAADWARLRERLIPAQFTPDLFVNASAAVEQPAAPPPPPVFQPEQPAEQPAPRVDQAAAPPAPPPPAAAASPPAIPAPAPQPEGRRMLSRGLS